VRTSPSLFLYRGTREVTATDLLQEALLIIITIIIIIIIISYVPVILHATRIFTRCSTASFTGRFFIPAVNQTLL
jgi:Na+/proline symporter